MKRITTRTSVILEVSPAAYDEIQAKLIDAGYDHTFAYSISRQETLIDLSGILISRIRRREIIDASRIPEETR